MAEYRTGKGFVSTKMDAFVLPSVDVKQCVEMWHGIL